MIWLCVMCASRSQTGYARDSAVWSFSTVQRHAMITDCRVVPLMCFPHLSRNLRERRAILDELSVSSNKTAMHIALG